MIKNLTARLIDYIFYPYDLIYYVIMLYYFMLNLILKNGLIWWEKY